MVVKHVFLFFFIFLFYFFILSWKHKTILKSNFQIIPKSWVTTLCLLISVGKGGQLLKKRSYFLFSLLFFKTKYNVETIVLWFHSLRYFVGFNIEAEIMIYMPFIEKVIFVVFMYYIVNNVVFLKFWWQQKR